MIFSFYKETENLKDHYDFLKGRQEQYAKTIGVEYKLYGDDDQYKEYKKSFKHRPYIDEYNIINFYKIHLLYENSKKYDKVAYFDFDVVPVTKDNIFDIDITDGIAVRVNHEEYEKNINFNWVKNRTKPLSSVRSPRAKFWNTKALLFYNGFDGANDVYNTGIVLANKQQLDKLAYFDNFEQDLDVMHELVTENGMYPIYITGMFGYDNETLFSYKMIENNVNLINLDEEWHYTLTINRRSIKNNPKLLHVINKKFEYVKKYVQKNNL
jgi:hypothetical protein